MKSIEPGMEVLIVSTPKPSETRPWAHSQFVGRTGVVKGVVADHVPPNVAMHAFLTGNTTFLSLWIVEGADVINSDGHEYWLGWFSDNLLPLGEDPDAKGVDEVVDSDIEEPCPF